MKLPPPGRHSKNRRHVPRGENGQDLVNRVHRKLLEENPDATNEHLLHALMRETHSPRELAEFHRDLEAHHAAHQERVARSAALEPKSDAQVLAASIDRLAQAIQGNHEADVAAASAVAAATHHMLSGGSRNG